MVVGSNPTASFFTVKMVFGGIPEWPKGPDCKSGGSAFAGSNPAPAMIFVFFDVSDGVGKLTVGVLFFLTNGIAGVAQW